MISHYTSLDGFYSIVQNQSLKLTRSEFLNDPSDCLVFNRLIERYLEDRKEKLSLSTMYESIKNIYTIAPLSEYIGYLRKSIHLYVFSMSKNTDEMALWNYYGNGGVELILDEDTLSKSLSKKLTNDSQYVACSKVIYVDDSSQLSDINVGTFSSIDLVDKDNQRVFELGAKKQTSTPNLYTTTDLTAFIKLYIKSYFQTLKHLMESDLIGVDTSKEQIFNAVFNNNKELNNYMVWKKDLTLFFIILSALVKSNTYEYEGEYRLVFFENTIETSRSIECQYAINAIERLKYIKPYIEFNNLPFKDFLKGATLSPLTTNMPIDSNSYVKIVAEFIKKHISLESDSLVNLSKHKIRW